MLRTIVVLMSVIALHAEVRVMSLGQAVELAMKQNPDIALARLDEQKATDAVRVARDPFVPKVVVGSGLAYSSGFPLSIEGSAPSVVRADGIATVFNRPQSYRVSQARESVRAAAIDSAARRDEVALRAALVFLDVAQLGQAISVARQQVAMLEQIAESTSLRVSEGRELPIESKRAALRVAQARQRTRQLEAARENAETTLAAVLGFGPEDRVSPSEQEVHVPPPAGTVEELVQMALDSSQETRRLESAVLSQTLEVKANRAAKLPRIDLMAQYALFARYNNYDDFFRKFQRNNGQLGISFQFPLLAGSAAAANADRANSEIAKLRIQMNQVRNRIATDTRQAHQEVERASGALDVARLDLDVAREQVSLLLAQSGEGRATLGQVEEARFAEAEKWIALYDARFSADRGRLALLKLTGNLMVALR